jgi:hypothetical protein
LRIASERAFIVDGFRQLNLVCFFFSDISAMIGVQLMAETDRNAELLSTRRWSKRHNKASSE